jgi:hypothetical protein
MNQRSVTVFRDLLLLALVSLLVVPSCSNSKKEDSSSGSFPTLIASEVTPVAEFTGGVAVAKFSSQDAKNELILDELTAKHASEMQRLKDSLCKSIQEASKKSGARSDLEAIAQEAVRDHFLIQFLRAASAAPPEKQTEIVQALDIKSSAADESPLAGGAALKDASLSSAQGALQVPPADTSEYTKYTNWLRNNPALSGFMLSLTAGYSDAIRDCP